MGQIGFSEFVESLANLGSRPNVTKYTTVIAQGCLSNMALDMSDYNSFLDS